MFRARVKHAAAVTATAMVAAMVGAGPAHAQDADDVDFLARRANDRCRRGEYERALDLFRQALDHGRTGRALGEMGSCELRVTRWADAEAHLREALALPDDEWVRRHRGDLVTWLAEAQSHVGRLMLTGGVPGLEVRVGDRAVTPWPMTEPMALPPGPTAVEASAPGYRTWRRTLEVTGGNTVSEVIGMEREPVMEPSAPATQSVACGAGLVLRGGLCYAPEGGPAARRGVSGWQVAIGIGASIAVVAGALAVGFGVDGASTESDYLLRCGGEAVSPGCVRDRVDTQSELDARASLVNGLVAVTAVGAALAVTALIVDRSAPARARVAASASGLVVRW